MARIDLHIHSCLSPCASLEMSPRAIVRRAQSAGLDCIALTDHNCAENLPAFADACHEAGMPCLFGLEVTASEEVHVLALFDELDRALDFGRQVYDNLQDYPNDPDRFGDQPIVTADGEIEGFAEKLLIGATSISFFDLIPAVQSAGGLCIPAHIDREVFGAIAHLGFLPDLPYSAVEVAAPAAPEEAKRWPVIRSSDAHAPKRIGRRFTEISINEYTVPALAQAFRAQLIQEVRP